MDLLSEEDLALIDALQINPRASWEQLGTAVGLSAISVARRWRRLNGAGLAWSGATLGPALLRGAFIELSCAPGSAAEIAETLCERPEVITVGRSLGDFDVYAISASTDPLRSAQSLLAGLGDQGIWRARAQLYTHVFGGPGWRLSVLNKTQSAELSRRGVAPAHPRGVDERERRLVLALQADARRSNKELAIELDMSPQAVPNLLERAERRGFLTLRVDVARQLAGYPLAGLLWVAVPGALTEDAGRWFAALPENRFCALVVSSSNMVVIANLREPEQLGRIAQSFSEAFPQATVTEQRIITSMPKVQGRMLHDDGRTDRLVRYDPWAQEPDAGARGV